MLTNEQMADAIDDAADLIEKDGWFALSYDAPVIEIGNGNNCALTALARVIPLQFPNASKVIVDILNLPRSVLEDRLDETSPNVLARWNNSQTNPQPVLDGFRKAAKVLRNEA